MRLFSRFKRALPKQECSGLKCLVTYVSNDLMGNHIGDFTYEVYASDLEQAAQAFNGTAEFLKLKTTDKESVHIQFNHCDILFTHRTNAPEPNSVLELLSGDDHCFVLASWAFKFANPKRERFGDNRYLRVPSDGVPFHLWVGKGRRFEWRQPDIGTARGF